LGFVGLGVKDFQLESKRLLLGDSQFSFLVFFFFLVTGGISSFFRSSDTKFGAKCFCFVFFKLLDKRALSANFLF